MGFKTYLWEGATVFRQFRREVWPAWTRYLKVIASSNLPPAGSDASDGKLARSVLLLAWEFPPEVGGGVYRPTSFARFASREGWKVTVVTGAMPQVVEAAGRYLEEGLPDELIVRRVDEDRVSSEPWLLPAIDGGIVNALSVFEQTVEAAGEGVSPIVLASGPPFHNFVAGYWAARRLGARLVLDYRDEWTECPFGFTRKDEVNRAWEAKCLTAADLVVFTTPSQLRHQVEVFPTLSEEKCVVVYNGWEPRDFASDGARLVGGCEEEQAPLRVAFFGNLGPMAQPDSFLAMLSEVLDREPALQRILRLCIVGRKSERVQALLDNFEWRENLELVGQVSKAEACAMMQDMDALLLLNPPSLHRYIQGKLYDYLASGTPILAYGKGGEMGEIVERLEAGFFVPEDDPGALEAALMLLRDGSLRVAGLDERQGWLASRTREAQAKVLLEHLEQLRAAG